MALNIGGGILSSTIDNSNNVIEFSGSDGDFHAIDRAVCSAGRDDGDVGTGLEYPFEMSQNYNHSSGGMATSGRYTAPYDGCYMFHIWFMIDNGGTYNNRRYRFRVNNAGTGQQIYVYSSNYGGYYAQISTANVLSLSAGDFVSVYTDNVVLYGAGDQYTRFTAVYLG